MNQGVFLETQKRQPNSSFRNPSQIWKLIEFSQECCWWIREWWLYYKEEEVALCSRSKATVLLQSTGSAFGLTLCAISFFCTPSSFNGSLGRIRWVCIFLKQVHHTFFAIRNTWCLTGIFMRKFCEFHPLCSLRVVGHSTATHTNTNTKHKQMASVASWFLFYVYGVRLFFSVPAFSYGINIHSVSKNATCHARPSQDVPGVWSLRARCTWSAWCAWYEWCALSALCLYFVCFVCFVCFGFLDGLGDFGTLDVLDPCALGDRCWYVYVI